MYVREFRTQLRDALDRYVDHMEDDGTKGPSRNSDEWFGDFAEFLTETDEGGDDRQASLVDLFDAVTGGGSDDGEED